MFGDFHYQEKVEYTSSEVITGCMCDYACKGLTFDHVKVPGYAQHSSRVNEEEYSSLKTPLEQNAVSSAERASPAPAK